MVWVLVVVAVAVVVVVSVGVVVAFGVWVWVEVRVVVDMLKPLQLIFFNTFFADSAHEIVFQDKDTIVINGKKCRLTMGQRQDLMTWLANSFNDKPCMAEVSIPHDGVGIVDGRD